MAKQEPKQFIPPHPKPKTHWLILKGRRGINPTPWKEIKPDLKLLK